ncbi:hypothetical protein HY405_02075 [Candidatus Microgenomates bacterium]|nr:hypothetical protein [Candidatus Microgenomates bacterium]
MSRRFALFVFLFFVFLFLTAEPVYAKRTLPRAGGSSGASSVSAGTSGVTTSVKFRADRLAINVTFKNLSVAKSVSYQLTYTGNGISQGAGGTVSDLTAEPQERELLFGTCSKGVCTYHTGVKNAKFVVTTTLKSGKKVIKTFKLRV